MSQIHNRKQLKEIRKELRNNSTSAELVLWHELKGKKLGEKFRRQHSVGAYVLDFYCTSARLAIELDGVQHFSPDAIAYDDERTNFLASLNIKVLRFENARVFQDLDFVLSEIRKCL